MLLRHIHIFFLLVLLGSFVACNDEDQTPPDEIEVYLQELMDVMETHSIYRNEINWTAFRESVIDTARSTDPRFKKLNGIRQALTLLGDNHSYLIASNGQYIGGFYPLHCESQTNFFLPKPENIGYIRVAGFSGAGNDEPSIAFAQAIQDEIAAQDSETLKGWIVDLRRNTGGNMYPMLAGIGPILGEGVAGYFIDANGNSHSFSYSNGTAKYEEFPATQITNPYQLKTPHLKVAVLLDQECGSSGEAIAAGFSGRENTRSFGKPTCGVSTGISGFELSDRSTLGLAISIMADRNMQVFGSNIPPDEEVDPDETLLRAAEWIESE